MKEIKNVIFDLGGVLVDLDIERCTAAFRELGMPRVADLINPYYPARDDLVLGAAQHGFQQHDVGRDVIDGEDRVILRFYGDVFHGERLFTMQI